MGVQVPSPAPFAGVTQWLECHPSKVDVTGSSPVARSRNKEKARQPPGFFRLLQYAHHPPLTDPPASVDTIRSPRYTTCLPGKRAEVRPPTSRPFRREFRPGGTTRTANDRGGARGAKKLAPLAPRVSVDRAVLYGRARRRSTAPRCSRSSVVEHVLGKDGVGCSIQLGGTRHSAKSTCL